jgi:hypothetical protein
MAAMIVDQLFEDGILASARDQIKGKSMWDFRTIAHKMKT